MPTIEQFNAYVLALSKHDWHFDYSEDPAIWRSGFRSQSTLLAQAQSHSVYRDAYYAHYAAAYGDTDAGARDAAIEIMRKRINQQPIAA